MFDYDQIWKKIIPFSIGFFCVLLFLASAIYLDIYPFVIGTPSSTPLPQIAQNLTRIAKQQATLAMQAVQTAQSDSTQEYNSAFQTAVVALEATRIYEQAQQDNATKLAFNIELSAQAGYLTPLATTASPDLVTSTPTLNEPNSTQTLQAAFGEIDQQFKSVFSSNIIFNKPEQMNQEETEIIELILNPTLSESDLMTEFVANSNLVTSTANPNILLNPEGQSITIETSRIDITPRMKAVLLSQDPDAFTIGVIHDNPEQVISSINTTRWQWSITAKKEGIHTLVLVIYRLVRYKDNDYWHEVETYKAPIKVQVTTSQWLKALDWKWIASALIIPFIVALWQWIRNRKNNPKDKKDQRLHSKRNRN